MANEDPWAAFENENDSEEELVDPIGSFLTIYFRKQSKVERWVNRDVQSADSRLFVVIPRGPFDAYIHEDSNESLSEILSKNPVVPGGLLLYSKSTCYQHFDAHVWEEERNISGDWVYRRLRPLQIAHETARWHKPNLEFERDTVSVIALSAKERANSRVLHDTTIKLAANLIRDTGYCILTGLEDEQICTEYGQAVLADLHHAARILMTRPKHESVDLYHPCDSLNDPSVYKELSMREDCRMDLRDGPMLRKHRTSANIPLRHHPDILSIISAVMNPVPFTPANYGRLNFDGQEGPQIKSGAVGGIVSLPGAADQAIHTDTPHLYEHIHLPAHYINAFTLGTHPQTNVGQTAFIHNSHRLDFVRKFIRDEDDGLNTAIYDYMVRPRMNLGDVVLFDTRILHFGLGNASEDFERPLLYTNFTQPWFHDPKNWDDETSIFE